MARVYRPTYAIPIPKDSKKFDEDGERFAEARLPNDSGVTDGS